MSAHCVRSVQRARGLGDGRTRLDDPVDNTQVGQALCRHRIPGQQHLLATFRGNARAWNRPALVATDPAARSGGRTAVVDATIGWQATISNPPPKAEPSTAAMIGVVERRRMMPYPAPVGRRAGPFRNVGSCAEASVLRR